MIIRMPLRQSIRDPSTNPPKAMFQLSGFCYKGSGLRATGFTHGLRAWLWGFALHPKAPKRVMGVLGQGLGFGG